MPTDFSIFGPLGLSVAVIGLLAYLTSRWTKNHINAPSVGGNGQLALYISGIKSFTTTRHWVQEGYQKHKSGIFKVPQFGHWMVVVCGKDLIDELGKAPEDKLSFHAATSDFIQADYTLGEDWKDESGMHVALIRGKLTRSLGDLFPDVIDEIEEAFKDELKLLDDEWSAFGALETAMRVVSRASGRIFVGLPLCRDEAYTDLNKTYTINVAISGRIIRQFPEFLKPLVGNYLTPMPRTYRQAFTVMAPQIEDRKQAFEEHGRDWPERPNDMLSWILERADGRERETSVLVGRILRLNFAAIHTTTISFTFALFHLASEVEKYLVPLRAEIDEIVASEGWTKAALEKMRKLDSFFRESQRHHGLGALTMNRRAVKPYRFSNGTLIPAGTFLAVAEQALQLDEESYERARVFDGFRFAEMNEIPADEQGEHRFISTSLEYVTFGHGKHACPGRFWAANEVKAMLAHLIFTYDVKLETDQMPEPEWFGYSNIPNRTARVMVKKRKTLPR